MPVSRRDFLGAAALGAVAPTLISATVMPMRTLGKTGAQVSILAFGGGSRFVSYGEEKGIAALNRALDLGITYIDTCDTYGAKGESQLWIGKVLQGRYGQHRAERIPGQRDAPRICLDYSTIFPCSLRLQELVPANVQSDFNALAQDMRRELPGATTEVNRRPRQRVRAHRQYFAGSEDGMRQGSAGKIRSNALERHVELQAGSDFAHRHHRTIPQAGRAGSSSLKLRAFACGVPHKCPGGHPESKLPPRKSKTGWTNRLAAPEFAAPKPGPTF